MRTALALAVENPHLAVTFLPLACSGATIATRLPRQRSASRECPSPGTSAACPSTVRAQIARADRRCWRPRAAQRADRTLDLVLLTIGANDILFSGLVANVIIEATTERTLFGRGGHIATRRGLAEDPRRQAARRFRQAARRAQAAGRRRSLARRVRDLRQSGAGARPARPAPAGATASTCIRPSAPTARGCARSRISSAQQFLPEDQGARDSARAAALPRSGSRAHDLRRRPSARVREPRRVRARRRPIRTSTAPASRPTARASTPIPRPPRPIRWPAAAPASEYRPTRRARAGCAPRTTAISPR